ncbi:hypothetical protein V3851_04410 [Paenibacillus sp. M1]|uniref:Phage protein n=1 Tax=Paenibacillus haidiansis TaxID=1574488 RepID=A0ABU7VMR7_9BACL
MSKEQLYFKILQEVSDRLHVAVEQYDKTNDGEQLKAAVIAILKGESKQ